MESSSLFDALKMKTLLADMWTTREQLCLASTVAKSGDKNWGVVSKSIQSLTTEKTRPSDWYSTKNCTFQYSKLLDQVELLKKRRDKELPPNETPQEFLLKLLTKKRVEELKQLLERERNRYNQLRKEILQLESNQLDNKLNQFWEEILKDQEIEEQEELKRQKSAREREEKLKNLAKYQAMKASMQSSLKPKGSMSSLSIHKGQQQTSTEESQATSDVSQVKKPKDKDIEGKDPDKIDPMSVDSENEVSSVDNHRSEHLPLSDVESTPKQEIEEESTTEKYFPVEEVKHEEEEEEEETKLPEDTFEVNKCDSSFETNLPLDYTSNLNTDMKEEEEDEDIEDDEEDDEEDQETNQEGTIKPVEDVECDLLLKKSLLLPPDVNKDLEKIEESDTRDDVPLVKTEEEQEQETETKETSECEKTLEEELEEELAKPGNILETENKEDKEVEEAFAEKETEEDLKRRREEKKKIRKKKALTDVINASLEDEKISKASSEEAEEVFPQVIKQEEKVDVIKQIPVVETEIKKIFTADSSPLIVSEGFLSIKDLEKKIPTTPTFKKEVKDEYEFDDDASRESTDVKDYMMSRSDRRKFSLSENVSSPVVSESTPSSPASTNYGDDPEAEKAHRVWKRSIMLLWNDIAAHKNASIFLKPITEEKVPGYHSIVYRPLDLMTIKRNIENGTIRTTSEFQRDILLMFLNAKMYNTRNHNIYRMAHDMMNDAVETLDEFIQAQMLAKVVETPQKSLRRETRESSAKRGVDDFKRKREDRDEKTPKRRKV